LATGTRQRRRPECGQEDLTPYHYHQAVKKAKERDICAVRTAIEAMSKDERGEEEEEEEEKVKTSSRIVHWRKLHNVQEG